MRLLVTVLAMSIGVPALAQRIVPAAPPSSPAPPSVSAPAVAPAPAASSAAAPDAPVAAPVPVADRPRVILETTRGAIIIELFPDKAPLTVANFLHYVDRHYYNGTIFHRVVSGFMVQGGGFTKDYSEKPAYAPIKNESANGLSNLRGSIAMARTSDPQSATSQFFFNLVSNDFLDASAAGLGYAVFGQVVQGMAVIDTIADVETLCPKKDSAKCTANIPPGLSDVPKEPIIIIKAFRQK